MKQFTIEQYGEAKLVGKEFGINFVGKRKEVFITLVNEAIAKKEAENKTEKASKTEKWYANGYGFNEGDTVVIEKKVVVKGGQAKEILQGRLAQIVKPAPTEGAVKALLIDKNGKLQNCEILLEIKYITSYKEEEVKEEEVA